MDRSSRLGKALKILAINLVMFAVLAELVGVAAYFYRTRTFYYTHRPAGKQVAAALEGMVEGFRIHPYLGFIVVPDGDDGADVNGVWHHNNFGFITPHDYPYPRQRPTEVLVGIFGGSVASHLASYERHFRVLSPRLAAHLGVAADDIRILNFGQGGFKQPQQLLLLSYLQSLGQELDLIVNIDGFNEVALGATNQRGGIAGDMPSIDHMRALQEVTAMADAEGIANMMAVRRAWAGYSRAYNRAWSGRSWETRFAAGFLLDWVIYRFHHRRYLDWRLDRAEQDDGRPASDSWLYLNEATKAGEIDWPSLVHLWARSSRAMHRQAQAAGIPYLHVVQPNQYFPTARTYSAEERAVAFAGRTPYAQPVVDGYPRLRDALPRLREAGVAAYGLFELFDGIDEAVYVDSCCHYTNTGHRVVAERVAELVIELMPPRVPGADGHANPSFSPDSSREGASAWKYKTSSFAATQAYPRYVEKRE